MDPQINFEGAFVWREEFAVERKFVLMLHVAPFLVLLYDTFSENEKNEQIFIAREDFDFPCQG